MDRWTMDQAQDSFFGHFTINGKEHSGILRLAGPKSKLEIYADDFLHVDEEGKKCVCGFSKTGESISALYCTGAGVAGTQSYHGRTNHRLTLWPNYIVFGPRHLNAEQPDITAISFTFTQANLLFYDPAIFGQVFGDRRVTFGMVRDILRRAQHVPRDRRRRGSLRLYFHWARGPIIEIRNAIGRITAGSHVHSRGPSPDGIDVRNRIHVRIDFAEPVSLDRALGTLHDLMGFFELATQSRQDIEDIALHYKDADREAPLRLYVSHAEQGEVGESLPTDVLVSGGLHSEEFESVLDRWLNTNPERGAARRRFVEGFRHGHTYEIDRLTGAANAFDLLPESDFAEATVLPPDVERLLGSLEARVSKEASQSEDVGCHKEQIFNALGRVRGLNLRRKVMLRYASLPASITEGFTDMPTIIAHSIRARNFFVHGARTKFSDEGIYDLAPFFTRTLEFIFATSELVRCGWNADRWSKESFSYSRLKGYIYNYEMDRRRCGANTVSASSQE